jgi:hypothetical protein
MDAFPKMKMFMLFEFQKSEDGGDLRDYRLSADERVRTSWLQDLQGASFFHSLFNMYCI